MAIAPSEYTRHLMAKNSVTQKILSQSQSQPFFIEWQCTQLHNGVT